MANQLDEMSNDIMPEGRDVNVIAKKVPVEKTTGLTLFAICIWALPILIGIVLILAGIGMGGDSAIGFIVFGVIIAVLPGIIFSVMKAKAASYFLQLEQKIQHDASQIDNYLEQRVMILKNAAKLLDKAIDFDKETFTKIAELRSGAKNDEERNELASNVENLSKNINVAFENYPELKAHQEIEDAMQQNSYLQREITAAREAYNDSILTWNREIFIWPIKKYVAAKQGYTTRIPFIASAEVKEQARGEFF